MTIKNLWGDFPSSKEVRTPKLILAEQAQVLSDSTKHVLVGSVSSKVTRGYDEDKNPVDQSINELDIVAPFLNNYRISIVIVAHDLLSMYPATVMDLVNKIPLAGFQTNAAYSHYIDCANEEELENALRMVLQSDRVHQIIESLLFQSEDNTPAPFKFAG